MDTTARHGSGQDAVARLRPAKPDPCAKRASTPHLADRVALAERGRARPMEELLRAKASSSAS